MPQLDTHVLPLLPLTTGVVLPGMVVTLTIESDEARRAVAAAESTDGELLLVPRIGQRFAQVGTVAKLEDVGRLRGGLEAIVIRGLHRAVVSRGVPGTGDAIWVEIDRRPDPTDPGPRAGDLAREYRATIEAIVEARGAPQVGELLRGITDPGQMADTSGYSPDLSFEQRVEVLETLDVERRLETVLAWAKEVLAEVELKDKIRTDVREGMERTQREYLLRQQMEAIRKELGEDTEGNVVEEYRRKIAEANMPEGARAEAERELGRLERTSEQSPEYGWIRTYLDWMTEIPWDVRTEDNLDIAEARRILDEDHTGLGDVKDRIVEYLAVRKLRQERGMGPAQGRGSGAILTLVGPPGVGKTSLGESVARALGRKFVRISLGGIHDEAEVRGHRRTYVGALPGRIVRALKEAGTKNPVMMLDEVDKVGADWRGDPSSALLEVLDPAQNHTFRDHYLEVDLDLSEVLFISTANVAETIPGPLLDRMEVIRLDGYTEDEKIAIARDHLLRRQVERNGLTEGEVVVTDDALRRIVADHTREAGVRNLERELGKALRKVATRLASGEATAPVEVDAEQVRVLIGRPRFFFEAAERTSVPGVATGLAVTGTGGDVLFIEATRLAGSEGDGLVLTGQLGDVMKESGQIALSYVRSHAAELDVDPARLGGRFHLHVPAGAVPKDGPSAGVTMVTALASLLSDTPVRAAVGMTGEVTLQGRVLPIGGVKQKVLAAHRSGLREVILPKRNEGDLDDVPEQVRAEMTFHAVETVDEVLAVALERSGAVPAAAYAARVKLAVHAREHRRNRESLRASGLDWTIGAAPWVTDDPPTGRYEAVLDATAPGRRLPSGDLATFALDAIERERG
ncbi:MAG TPA: endopeptidase La [Actinomycetota bacterium]|nr:endopeptidase La [Actinomycetota bacterium]